MKSKGRWWSKRTDIDWHCYVQMIDKKNFQLTTILFIWSISTIFAMVTFLKFGYTFFAIGTSKFRQITRSAFTFVFILFVATIIISVTFFGFGNAKAVSTFDILVLACAIIWKIILKVTNRLCSTMYVLGKKISRVHAEKIIHTSSDIR